MPYLGYLTTKQYDLINSLLHNELDQLKQAEDTDWDLTVNGQAVEYACLQMRIKIIQRIIKKCWPNDSLN